MCYGHEEFSGMIVLTSSDDEGLVQVDSPLSVPDKVEGRRPNLSIFPRNARTPVFTFFTTLCMRLAHVRLVVDMEIKVRWSWSKAIYYSSAFSLQRGIMLLATCTSRLH